MEQLKSEGGNEGLGPVLVLDVSDVAGHLDRLDLEVRDLVHAIVEKIRGVLSVGVGLPGADGLETTDLEEEG